MTLIVTVTALPWSDPEAGGFAGFLCMIGGIVLLNVLDNRERRKLEED